MESSISFLLLNMATYVLIPSTKKNTDEATKSQYIWYLKYFSASEVCTCALVHRITITVFF